MMLLVSPSAADDYFDQITVFSEGRITRFVEMPIRVYIAPMLRTEPYLPALRYAMREWEAAADGKVRFEIVESRDADIRVSWGYDGFATLTDTALGKTHLTRHGADRFSVEIILPLDEASETTERRSQAELRTVCLHEIGHAIGLWGHSPEPLDSIYFGATAQRPTDRDRATLLKVYVTPNNTPQHDVAISALKKRLATNPLLTNPLNARPHYLLGTIYLDKGDIEPAIESFSTALSVDPDFHPVREKLLQVYQQAGRLEEAIRLLNDTLEQKPSPDAYNTLGVMYYKSGNIDQSALAFGKSLELSPYYPSARKNLYQVLREQGLRALNTGAFGEATVHFQNALRFNPNDAELYRLMGDSYAKRGELDNAIAQYQKAYQFNPADRELQQNLARYWSNYGVQLTAAERWAAAISAYQHALELLPTLTVAKTNLIAAYWRQANAYRQSGDIDRAIDVCRKLLEVVPNDADAYGLLGELHLKKGAYPQAIQAFQSARNATPRDPQPRRNLVAARHQYAQHLTQQKQYASAIEQLRNALQLAPKNINLRQTLAEMYQRTGDFERAKAEWTQILADNPQTQDEPLNQHIVRGNALMNMNDYTAALAEFEAIDDSVKSADVYNTIGYLYLMKNRPLDAIAAFESALAKQPFDLVAYQNLLAVESQFARQLVGRNSPRLKNLLAHTRASLSRCCCGRNEPLNALAKYRAALDLSSTDPQTRVALVDTGVHLALAFQKQNRQEPMQTVIQWLQELDADNLIVKRLLEVEDDAKSR